MNIDRVLTHLSPSSLNLWIANPRQWVRQYLIKDGYGDSNAAIWRGKSLEVGFEAMLRGFSPADAYGAALGNYELFKKNTRADEEEGAKEEWENIRPMMGHLARCQWPKLRETQVRVEYPLAGLPIPTIGYVDFGFEDGDADLKTTGKAVNKLGVYQGPHIRQASLYRAARRRPGRLIYVWPNGVKEHEIDDIVAEEALDVLERAAASLDEFLSRQEAPDTALASLPYNPDDFRSSPPHRGASNSGFEPVEIA